MRLNLPTRTGEGAAPPLVRPYTPDPHPTATPLTPIPPPPTPLAAPLQAPSSAPFGSLGPGSALMLAQPPSSYEGAATGAAAGTGVRVDTAGAYAGPQKAWSAAHQQWCVLISFASALLRSLGQFLDVEAGIIDFLAAIEPRLLLTSVPPAGDAAQPLTLAGLFELERVLFLLCHFARYAGSWHFALPGSLPKFRMALTSFLTFAAKADSIRPVTLECPPQSAQEKEMAAQPSGTPSTKGWFRVCSLGASNPGELAPTNPGYLATKGGSLLAAPSPGTPPPPTPGLFGGYREPGEDAAQAGNGVSSTCSLYSARLAESMYTCILHACLFLRATAPQLCFRLDAEPGPILGCN
ncbi:hypothetical protein DUNSADRAFT_1096 [Dunaliella salina]|uniref:Uncharacterized protein n=1 Tax=Dunaliella salina TaxID=3046 RepID=A0ABQ7GXI4_DUNSA|nr:hypothetical protein DUNSADRAFT_1096 [Dunaliella salina]|eukprot:KAF5839319.1 hypothetical protein DUNSADRAFT_1096 [Dunaliella salina]